MHEVSGPEDLLRAAGWARTELRALAEMVVKAWVEAKKSGIAIGYRLVDTKKAKDDGRIASVVIDGEVVGEISIQGRKIGFLWLIGKEEAERLYEESSRILEVR